MGKSGPKPQIRPPVQFKIMDRRVWIWSGSSDFILIPLLNYHSERSQIRLRSRSVATIIMLHSDDDAFYSVKTSSWIQEFRSSFSVLTQKHYISPATCLNRSRPAQPGPVQVLGLESVWIAHFGLFPCLVGIVRVENGYKAEVIKVTTTTADIAPGSAKHEVKFIRAGTIKK